MLHLEIAPMDSFVTIVLMQQRIDSNKFDAKTITAIRLSQFVFFVSLSWKSCLAETKRRRVRIAP